MLGGDCVEHSFFRAILFGWITILLTLLLSTFTIAVIVRFSSIQEVTVSYMTTIVAFICLFIAGFIAGIKGKKNGLVIGIVVGASFTLITFLIQYLGYDATFTTKQLLFHLGYIAICIIGSIIGVNMSPTTTSS